MANKDLDISGTRTVPLTADSNGGQLNLFPGNSTGAGRAVVSIKKASIGTPGAATLNSYIDGFIIGGSKILVDNVTTPLFHAVVANNTTTGFIVSYCAQATNGVDVQIETGECLISVMNKGGVFTNSEIDVKSVNAHTTGTITVTWSFTNGVDINVKVDTSLTPSVGYPRISYNIQNLDNQAISLY